MMFNMSNISFANPLWFLLLLVIPLYVILHWRKGKVNSIRLGIPEAVSDMTAMNWKRMLHKLMPFLFFTGFTLLTIAMARPQEKFQKQKITSEGIDIIIALDLSLSMLAKDFNPDRLAVAKQVISEFIKERPSDRIGLTIFAGEGYTASPPTLDHKVLQQFLQDLQFGLIKNGTAIGMGLSTSVNRLKDSKARSKIVILVTDGSNNTGMIDPLSAADIAKTFGVKVYTIGVGTNGEALFPQIIGNRTIYRKSLVEIDEDLLRKIASETGGQYFRATDEAELKSIYDTINKLEKTEFDSTTLVRREDRYFPFLWSGLLFLTIHFMGKFTLFRNIYTA